MPKRSPYEICLTAQERVDLESRARSYTTPYFRVIRAKIVLLAAEGLQNKDIAEHLHIPPRIVSKWRKRYFEDRLDGLDDRPRRGRPRVFSP